MADMQAAGRTFGIWRICSAGFLIWRAFRSLFGHHCLHFYSLEGWFSWFSEPRLQTMITRMLPFPSTKFLTVPSIYDSYVNDMWTFVLGKMKMCVNHNRRHFSFGEVTHHMVSDDSSLRVSIIRSSA